MQPSANIYYSLQYQKKKKTIKNSRATKPLSLVLNLEQSCDAGIRSASWHAGTPSFYPWHSIPSESLLHCLRVEKEEEKQHDVWHGQLEMKIMLHEAQ